MRSLILLCISLIVFSSAFAQDHKHASPNVKLEDINGKKVQLKNWFGKGPVIISFWATWCMPCQEELAEYQKLYNEYKERGVQMLAISIDDEKSAAKVKPFVKSRNYSFTILLDSNSDAAHEFYVHDVPNTFLLDKKGNIVFSHHSYKRGDELELKKNIEELLK